MAKQGQHNGDSQDSDKSKGPNNPSKSVEITTGSYKKPETYKEEAAEHKANNAPAQHAKNEWDPDTHDKPSIEGSTRARESDLDSGRSGSDSNRSRGTEGH